MSIFFLTDHLESCPKIKGSLAVTSLDDIPKGSKVILFSYGRIVPEKRLQEYHFYNVHNSLLPKYRGLHALTWAIINGEKEVGYSFHKIDDGIDSGDIGAQLIIPVTDIDDINDVFQKARKRIPIWLAEIIHEVENETLTFIPQDEKSATYVTRRVKSDGLIDWRQSSFDIHNLIRAIAPPYAPGAYTHFMGNELVITKSILRDSVPYKCIPGQIVARLNNSGVLIKTGTSIIQVTEVIFRGKKTCPSKLFKSVGIRLG